MFFDKTPNYVQGVFRMKTLQSVWKKLEDTEKMALYLGKWIF